MTSAHAIDHPAEMEFALLRELRAASSAARLESLAGAIEHQVRAGLTDATDRAAIDLQRQFSGVRAALLHTFAPHGHAR